MSFSRNKYLLKRVRRNVTGESSTRIRPCASTKRNRISFRLIDRCEASRGALLQPLLSAAIRRSQRLRRSYRERLIAQLSRRIARSKIIFIHRNTRCTRIFVYAVHEPYDFKRAKKRLDGSELLIEVRLGLDVQLIN